MFLRLPLFSNSWYRIYHQGYVIASVADPHHIDADPDPTYHFDAHPDPTHHFDADPDPDSDFI
jgi:hypothetical protein